jgi:hypothetical protein
MHDYCLRSISGLCVCVDPNRSSGRRSGLRCGSWERGVTLINEKKRECATARETHRL